MAILAFAALQVLGGCKKALQETAHDGAPPPASAPSAGGAAASGSSGDVEVRLERPVVDEEVRRHWRAVELTVREKKAGGSARPVQISLGGEALLPGSGMVIRVLGFVPDFAMGADSITTKSMRDQNPAVKLQVLDDGREIFKGWAFRDYPEMHSFEDPRYAIVLSRAIAAGE